MVSRAYGQFDAATGESEMGMWAGSSTGLVAVL